MPPKTSSTSASLTLLLMQITGRNVKHTKRDKELKIHEWQSKQKQAKQQHFPKQKQHVHIFIPKQSWAVMCPRCSLSQVNCISVWADLPGNNTVLHRTGSALDLQLLSELFQEYCLGWFMVFYILYIYINFIPVCCREVSVNVVNSWTLTWFI